VRFSFKGMSLLPALALAVGLVALPATAASADTTTTLPITSFDGMVVDSAHSHLLISENDSIVVTSFTGTPVKTISGLNGLDDVLLSSDDSTIYILESGSDDVLVYSATTFLPVGSYPLPAGDVPYGLALQSGKLWVAYNDTKETGTNLTGAIGDFELTASTTAPPFTPDALPGTWTPVVGIAADPSNTGVLLATSSGGPAHVAAYDTVNDTVIKDQDPFFSDDASSSGASVIPGGEQFILSASGGISLYGTSDMSQQGSYPDDANFTNSLAVDPATGAVAMGQEISLANTPDISVFEPGNISTPINSYNTGNSLLNVAPGGLAWSADGSKLFAVLAQTSTRSAAVTYELDVFDNPTLGPTSVGLSGPSTALIGKPFSFTGFLDLGSASAPAGTPVTVTRTLAGSKSKAVFNLQTDENGDFLLTDAATAYGTYTYTVSYGGSSTYVPSSYSQTVEVMPLTTTLTLSTSASTVAYGAKVTATATLGKTDTNRTVSIYETPAGGSKKLIETHTVNAKGQVSVTETLAQSASFTAAFTGDAQYAAVTTAAKTVDAQARVSASVSGYYQSERAGSTTYRVYHHTAKQKVDVTVAPNKHGECVQLVVQRYSGGTWKAYTTTGCTGLDSSSEASPTLTLTTYPQNTKYRVRVDYVRSSKDTTNLSTDGGWMYFIVVK
jgi:hypothetical protein